MHENYEDTTPVEQGIARADGEETPEVEVRQVKKALKEHEQACKFDGPAYKQFRIDRTYAAGRADLTWASDANLIGSFIDVLVAFLYARDPDMSCRPARNVRPSPMDGLIMAQAAQMPDQFDRDALAETMDIVISRLWKDGRLKRAIKKQVRSALSVGPGWIKALMLVKTGRDPQIERELNDAQDNLRRLRAKEAEVAEGSAEDQEVTAAEIEQIISGLEANVEVIIRAGMALDYVRAEDIQTSLDVAEVSDYLDADWIDHSIYVPKCDLRKRFENFTDHDVKKATCYYQKRPFTEDNGDSVHPTSPDGGDHSTFTKNAPNSDAVGGSAEVVEFAKIIERWDKRDNLIRTMVDGVHKWAVEPYAPPLASTRFYPFFMLAFFEVDNERYPQSLSWRLRKLQDEYSNARSNFRRVRERIQPGTVFNSGMIEPDEARKLTASEGAEFIGIKPVNPDADFNKIFAPKPTASINHNLYDTQPILSDMERISGVQEALQSTVQTAKTATEAEIQQSGFASRTSAHRDALEDMLRDLAHYTAELALQAVPAEQAQRMAGPYAFWPEGMEREDILTLVNVDIDAGSTGKPNTDKERETWSIVMPMVQQMLVEIRMLQATDPMLAASMVELLKETLSRLDDRFDVDKLIPMGAPPPPMLPPPPGEGGESGAPTFAEETHPQDAIIQ
jgi:hypothetical protein